MRKNAESSKISIIVPVFNSEQYIDNCVASILCQSFSNIELLLIDDGSTDGSLKKCQDWERKDKRVKCYSKKNGGASSARNMGLELCSGDYIGFVDSDDYVSEKMYEELFSTICYSPFIIGQTMIKDVFPDHEDCDESFYNFDEEDYNTFLKGMCLQKRSSSFCSKLFPKDFFKELRFEEGKTNEDFLLFFSVAETNKYKIVCTHTVGYYYIQRTDSITHTNINVYKDAIDNSLKVYKKKYDSELAQYIARFYLHYCTRYFLLCAKYNIKTFRAFHASLKNNMTIYGISLKNKYLNRIERMILSSFLSFPAISFAFFKIGFRIRRLKSYDKRTT